jgi:transposase-like protein
MQSNSTKFARRYDREFKENAVALIQSGRSITDGVARSGRVALVVKPVVERCPERSGFERT